MGTRGAGTRAATTRRDASRPPARRKSHGATYSVVLMTAVALLGVVVLAAQAARAAPKVSDATGKAGSKSAAQPTASTTASPAAGGSGGNANALPANSGSGTRVVYSVNGQRIWLVGGGGSTVERTFQVVPGTVAAPTGSYSVTRKEPGATGSDGTPVQYVVLFGQRVVDGQSTTFGFDAVANVTGLPPKPTSRTGGVRMAQLDAQALFNFVSVGSNITVVN
jgi:lipoprotein-anchoring transpeptidase ErfK/SrfK